MYDGNIFSINHLTETLLNRAMTLAETHGF